MEFNKQEKLAILKEAIKDLERDSTPFICTSLRNAARRLGHDTFLFASGGVYDIFPELRTYTTEITYIWLDVVLDGEVIPLYTDRNILSNDTAVKNYRELKIQVLQNIINKLENEIQEESRKIET